MSSPPGRVARLPRAMLLCEAPTLRWEAELCHTWARLLVEGAGIRAVCKTTRPVRRCAGGPARCGEDHLPMAAASTSPVEVSVVVCGYNRREALLRTCDALVKQDWPPHRYEIIVADNASSDGSAQAMQEFARGAPVQVRCLVESRPGKVNALAAGIAAARGAIVAFTDDDCVPRPEWISALVAPLADAQVGLVCGPVPSHFSNDVEVDPEKRFLARKFVGDFQLGAERRELRGRESPLGCNMAVRAEALRAVGGFSPLLGPSAARWGDHEDSDLAWRIRDAGYRLVYEPTAVVDHYPDASRLSRAVIRSRAVAIGRCGCIARRRGASSRARRCVLTAGFAAEVGLRAIRWLVCAPFSRKRFIAEFRLLCAVGKLTAVWIRPREHL